MRHPSINRRPLALASIMAVLGLSLGCAGTTPRTTAWHSLAEALDRADALAEGPEYPTARSAAIKAARAMLSLGVGQGAHPATSIYYCRRLSARGDEPARRCQYIVADDTIHTAEFPDVAQIAVPRQVPVRLEGLPGAAAPGVATAPAVLALEYGETKRMHVSGYRHMMTVKLLGAGALVLPDRSRLSAEPGVLTLAMRLPERPGRPGWVVKWVWLLDLSR